jgi:hypothetical protein
VAAQTVWQRGRRGNTLGTTRGRRGTLEQFRDEKLRSSYVEEGVPDGTVSDRPHDLAVFNLVDQLQGDAAIAYYCDSLRSRQLLLKRFHAFDVSDPDDVRVLVGEEPGRATSANAELVVRIRISVAAVDRFFLRI